MAAMAEERVDEPNINDVLCGRGGSINSHAGNEYFRQLVEKRKRVYLTARFKREKRLIASSIVSEIRAMDPPGRFLARKGGKENGYWYDIGDEKARDKTSQALRENAPSIRAEIETEINQQRNEMKQKEQMTNEHGKSSPSSTASAYPPPPPHSYYNPRSYWEYYYHHYGYPPLGPPGHPSHPPPTAAGTAPSYPHPHTHPPTPPASASSTPAPRASSSSFGFPWGAGQPQTLSPIHHAFKEGDLHQGGTPMTQPPLPTSQVTSQEHNDHQMAAALQHKENEAAFEDRKKRFIADPAAKLRQSVAFVSPGCNPPMLTDEQLSNVAKAPPAVSAFATNGTIQSSDELTQEELDHRFAVALQEQEDNELRFQIEHTSRRSSRSNAFPIHGGSNNLCRNNIAWVQNDGNLNSASNSHNNGTSTFKQIFPSSFAAWTKGTISAEAQVDASSPDLKPKAIKSVHFGGNVLPPPSNSGTSREMSYSPLHFEQNQESSSSLMSQAARHFLGSVGSWDNSNTALMDSSDGTFRVRIQEQMSGSSAAATGSELNDIQSQNLQEIQRVDSGEGQEVELMDVRDESSMPPPKPRFQIDWSSRAVPESMGGSQLVNPVHKHRSMSKIGVSPSFNLEMDESANSHLSGNGSLGGGSLCNLFNEKEPSPDEMIYRVLQQVPSWERSMRSRSPLSISSVDEEADSLITVRNPVGEKPFGPLTPIKDDPNEMNTSMDWE